MLDISHLITLSLGCLADQRTLEEVATREIFVRVIYALLCPIVMSGYDASIEILLS